MKLYFVYYQDHDGIQDYGFYVCPNVDNAKTMFVIQHPDCVPRLVEVEEVLLTKREIELLRKESNDYN